MRYQVSILRRALKSLEKIGTPDYERIKSAVFSLSENPVLLDVKSFQAGMRGEYAVEAIVSFMK
ncbi:MAG: hypothetical protein JW768_02010 [Chitinispirillaceae bacterium]|nr:hypothetical protein [Chitinispirillaceae bacterium]